MRVLFFVLASFGALFSALSARAQIFNGSDGTDGALNVTVNTTIQLPPDGILNYTTINVSGATLTFQRNSLNTPVYLLATGDVTISGTISVKAPGKAGGPGGFDGGDRGFNELPAGPGHGPGGGGGETSSTSTGIASGAYRPLQQPTLNPRGGSPYGSPLLVPLVGGSGAGGLNGSPGQDGGGGGGAILIASDTRITMNGYIDARGHHFGSCNDGSGGAVRLVAPVVAGSGTIDVTTGGCNWGGFGRVRIDTADITGLALSFSAGVGAVSFGTFLVAFPTVVPRLDILQVGDQPVAGGTAATITFPFGGSTTQTVQVRAQDFGSGAATVYMRLEPNSGVHTLLGPFTISNNTTSSISATFPINNPTRVVVWGEPVSSP